MTEAPKTTCFRLSDSFHSSFILSFLSIFNPERTKMGQGPSDVSGGGSNPFDGLGVDEPKCGWKVLAVFPNSPSSGQGIIPYFSVLTHVNGIRVGREESELIPLIKEGIPATLKFLNLSTLSSKDIQVTPRRGWGGDGLLGLMIRHDYYENAHLEAIHVLEVHHGSPAELAGLRAHVDYLLGDSRIAFKSYDALDLFLTQHQNKEGRLIVFNKDSFSVREVVIRPNTQWGGAGSLGCDVGIGYLHQLPIDGKHEVRYEGEDAHAAQTHAQQQAQQPAPMAQQPGHATTLTPAEQEFAAQRQAYEQQRQQWEAQQAAAYQQQQQHQQQQFQPGAPPSGQVNLSGHLQQSPHAQQQATQFVPTTSYVPPSSAFPNQMPQQAFQPQPPYQPPTPVQQQQQQVQQQHSNAEATQQLQQQQPQQSPLQGHAQMQSPHTQQQLPQAQPSPMTSQQPHQPQQPQHAPSTAVAPGTFQPYYQMPVDPSHATGGASAATYSHQQHLQQQQPQQQPFVPPTFVPPPPSAAGGAGLSSVPSTTAQYHTSPSHLQSTPPTQPMIQQPTQPQPSPQQQQPGGSVNVPGGLQVQLPARPAGGLP